MISYNITLPTLNKLRHLSKCLAEKYAEIKGFSIQEKKAIQRYARISMIGASTRIENAVLTDQEIDWIDTILSKDGKVTEFNKNKALIENKLSKDRERSIEEVAGCREMLFLIYEQAKDLFPVTEATLRGLHFELMKYYSNAGPYIGKYKTQPNYVVEHNQKTKEQRIVFKTAEAGPITASAVSDLICWYNKAIIIEPWSIAVACEFVYRFLAIHPFQDGNGRLGRGLLLLALLQSPDELISYIAPYLAIDRHIERYKMEYYMVLNRCSNGMYSNDPKAYKIEYFLNFILKVLEESLNDITFYRDKYLSINTLSEAATKVLTCFKEHPELRLSTKLICNDIGLPRRTAVNALNTLLAEKLIQRYGKGASVRYQLTF